MNTNNFIFGVSFVGTLAILFIFWVVAIYPKSIQQIPVYDRIYQLGNLCKESTFELNDQTYHHIINGKRHFITYDVGNGNDLIEVIFDGECK